MRYLPCPRSALVYIVAIGGAACQDAPLDFEVVATFPHDSSAYTQGLVMADGVLFESTGLYTRSDVRQVDMRTGVPVARRELDSARFGEGLAVHGGRLYQLTWRENIAYVYAQSTLARIDSFSFPGEGWGLASDGTQLFLSDGSDSIRVLDPGTFSTKRVLHVHDRGSPLRQLNELEFFQGRLLANVYPSDWIAVINPADGQVERMLDFADLYPKRAKGAAMLNGIAVTPDGTRLLLTGKFWPTLYEVRIR